MGDFITWGNQSPAAWIGLTIVIIVIVVWLYFLPTIIARKRRHNDALAIFVLNLISIFTGGIGWIVALVWACTNNIKK